MFTLKKGSQQKRKTPIIRPNVLAVFLSFFREQLSTQALRLSAEVSPHGAVAHLKPPGLVLHGVDPSRLPLGCQEDFPVGK